MGKKVFISYKYGDTNVQRIGNNYSSKVRDYVDVLQDLFEETPHIFKAEEDGNDLSQFKDETIASTLRDKIFDSTLTIVLISQGMKTFEKEEDQWIPWEVSYSLKEHSRNGRMSSTNGMLAVVLPNSSANYDYFLKEDSCQYCHCRTLITPFLFKILGGNMFNIKKPEYSDCVNHSTGSKPLLGHSSYIYSVKWSDFIGDINTYLDIAVRINETIEAYEIVKVVG